MNVRHHDAAVAGMFGRIAGVYDLGNHLLSCGIDLYWRRVLADTVRPGPTGRVLDLAAGTGACQAPVLLLVGLVAAVALVLPGISFSYLLLLLGLYDPTIQAINALDLGFLLPLAAGVLAGILLTTKVLERLMTRHPRPTYLVILGFVLASVPAVFPGWPAGIGELLLCLAALAAGFGAIYRLPRL